MQFSIINTSIRGSGRPVSSVRKYKDSTSCLRRRFQESVSGLYSGLRADSAAAARSAKENVKIISILKPKLKGLEVKCG